MGIVNNASMNMGVNISLHEPDLNDFEHVPKVGFGDHMVILFSCFKEPSHS